MFTYIIRNNQLVICRKTYHCRYFLSLSLSFPAICTNGKHFGNNTETSMSLILRCSYWSQSYLHNLVINANSIFNKVQYIPRYLHTICALRCLLSFAITQFYPYLSGLLNWHWGDHMIAPVPVKLPWTIWVIHIPYFNRKRKLSLQQE